MMLGRARLFERLMELHPVLPLVVESGDVEREDLILNAYVNSRARSPDHILPMSITQFYQHYVETLKSVDSTERRNRMQSNLEFGMSGSQSILDTTDLTIDDITQLQQSLHSIPETHNIIPNHISNLPGLKSWLEQIKVDNKNNSSSYANVQSKFTEPGVQKYLVVHNLAKTITEAWNSGWLPSHTKQLTFFFKRTAIGQARFWEMWGMLFGSLISFGQKELFEEMLDVAHGVIKKVDISQSELCCAFASMVYESKNRHRLTQYSEEYLPNQTIKIDGKEIKFYEPFCLSYLMVSVGYLLEVTRFIHSLTLSNLGITVHHLRHLLNAASGSTVPHTLQMLDLSHNKLDVSGMKLLQVFLVKATSLTHLNLSDCAIGPQAMMALARVIDCMPLVSLNLSRNNIGNSGTAALAAKWANCYCLTDIDLSCNNITDSGAVVIGQNLKKLLSLRSLRLFGNEIMGDGIYSIYRGVDELKDIPVPCGYLAREDTSKEFTCAVHLEACAVLQKRTFDRTQMNMKLRIPKPEPRPEETKGNASADQSNTYVGYDTVDSDQTLGEGTILESGRKSQGRSAFNSTLCKHDSLLVTSTPLRTPTRTGIRVASILSTQPRTPVRRRWSTLPHDLSADTTLGTTPGATPGCSRTLPLDRSTTKRMIPLDRSATIGGIDRSGATERRRPSTLERTPSTRVMGRRPSVQNKQWNRERRLNKIMSKPLLDRSVLDITSTHTHSTVSFLDNTLVS